MLSNANRKRVPELRPEDIIIEHLINQAEATMQAVTQPQTITDYLVAALGICIAHFIPVVMEETFKRLCMMIHPTLVLVLPLYEWAYVYPHQNPIARVGVVLMHVASAYMPLPIGVMSHLLWNSCAMIYFMVFNRREYQSVQRQIAQNIINECNRLGPNRSQARRLSIINYGLVFELPDYIRQILQRTGLVTAPRRVGRPVQVLIGVAAVIGSVVLFIHRRALFRAPTRPVVPPPLVPAAAVPPVEVPAECPICLLPLDDPIIVLGCAHGMHEQCHLEYVNQGYGICPICRAPFGDHHPPVVPDDVQDIIAEVEENELPADVQHDNAVRRQAAANALRVNAPVPLSGPMLAWRGRPIQRHERGDGPQVINNPAAPGDIREHPDPGPGDQALSNPDSRTFRVVIWRNYRIPNLRRYWFWSRFFRIKADSVDPVMQYNFHPDDGSYYQDGWIEVALPEVLVCEMMTWWTHRSHTLPEYEVSITKCRELMRHLNIDPQYLYHCMQYAPTTAYYLHANALTWSLSRLVRDDYIRPSAIFVALGCVIIGVMVGYGFWKMRWEVALFIFRMRHRRGRDRSLDLDFLINHGI